MSLCYRYAWLISTTLRGYVVEKTYRTISRRSTNRWTKQQHTSSYSIRMTEPEIELFEKIVNRRNENSIPSCRLTKTRVILTCVLNWIHDNQDNDEPFRPHPSKLMKHDM